MKIISLIFIRFPYVSLIRNSVTGTLHHASQLIFHVSKIILCVGVYLITNNIQYRNWHDIGYLGMECSPFTFLGLSYFIS